jgi:hypothetical protein
VPSRIQFRRGDDSSIPSGSSVSDGEPLFTTDSHRFFVCEGGTPYEFARVGLISSDESAAATTPGSVIAKVPVYDETGTLIGYLPVYDDIT